MACKNHGKKEGRKMGRPTGRKAEREKGRGNKEDDAARHPIACKRRRKSHYAPTTTTTFFLQNPTLTFCHRKTRAWFGEKMKALSSEDGRRSEAAPWPS
jgi:hypothetical protein